MGLCYEEDYIESQRKTSCHRVCKAAVKHGLPVATVPSKLILKPSETASMCGLFDGFVFALPLNLKK